MGRWFYSKKDTADGHKSISVKKLKEWGYSAQGWRSGTFTWSRHGEQVGSMGVSVEIQGQIGAMRLTYTYDETEQLNYEIKLVSTPCHYGGFRWWFICPLIHDGYPCQRRVGVLYLASKYAGCRICYDLTYQSCQDSHKFDALARRIGSPSETALKQALGW